jgi:hypothetical protein
MHIPYSLTHLEISGQIFIKILISNFMKIRCLGSEFCRVDGQKDTTKLIVAFRNFANEPKWTDWQRSSILETSVVMTFDRLTPAFTDAHFDPTTKPTRFDSTRRREDNSGGRCWAVNTFVNLSRREVSNDSGSSLTVRHVYFRASQCVCDPPYSCPRQQLFSTSDQDDVATCKNSDASLSKR